MSGEGADGPPAARDALAERHRNALLARLPDDEDARLLPRLRVVELELREPVERHGRDLVAVHFPLDAVVSVVDTTDSGADVEITTIGNEGVVGMHAFLDAPESPFDVYCQVPGRVLRLSVPDLREYLATERALHSMFRRYTQVTIAQLSRNVVCRRLHQAEQRTARWLLTTHDRVGADDFLLTQEFLAQMVGVRRVTVSEAARRFHHLGLIRYTRGRITITDRDGLEAASCHCYHILRTRTQTLLGQHEQP